MVHNVTVNLGSFTISNNTDEKFRLSVSTDMSFSYPDNLPVVSTAVELWDQVKDGSLWITRAGACRFKLNIYFEETAGDSLHAILQAQKREAVEEAFQTFPAWNTLGLELRAEVSAFEEGTYSHEAFVYSVQHTRQHSGLFTPQGVACGSLSVVSSSFRFGAQRKYPAETNNNDSRIVTLKVSPLALRRITGCQESSTVRNLPSDLQAERLKHLTHNALNLIVGLKKKPTGVRILKRSRSPTLLDLAPAVWNSTYFQDAVTRAQLAPSISSTLANIASTQSPLLRQKLGELVQQQSPNPQIEDVAGELHKRILVLLLRTTYVQRTKSRGIMASRQHRTQSSESFQNDHSGDLNESRYVSLAHDKKAPTSDPLQEFEDPDDGILGGLDESPGYSEHDEEHQAVLFGRMGYSSEHSYGDIDETYFRRPNDPEPESMGADDIIEDTLLYTTGEYDPEYRHANLTSNGTGHVNLSQEMNPYPLRDHAREVQRSYRDPDDMEEEEELSGHDEYHPIGEEEGDLKHQSAFDDTGIVDLSADTSMYASSVKIGYDNEMSYIEEGPPALIRAYRDDTYGHCDADGAFQHETPYDGNSYHHPCQLNDQGHCEGGFHEGSDEGDIYYAHQYYAQDDLCDQAMPKMPNTDVEISGMQYSQGIGHIDDHPADTVCTAEVPEYTCQVRYAEGIEMEGSPSYAYLERHPHGSDDIPRTYPRPPAQGARWARSPSDGQELIGTQHPPGGPSDYGFTHGHFVETLDRKIDVFVSSSATGNLDMC